MFDFQNSVFSDKPEMKIPQGARIVFVSDLFVEDYVGGAELTTQALIDASPMEVFKLHSKDVTLEMLRLGADRFWIFGNFSQLNPQLIPTIVGNIRYSIVEYDFKFCSFRSPEKHQQQSDAPCDCDQQMNGKIISAFFYGAMGLWWMSEEQMHRTHARFPFLAEKDNIVLSSVFSPNTIARLRLLREGVKIDDRKGWIVLGSPSWIKGADDAVMWCKETEKDHEVIWNLPYDDVLVKLASSKGFVYLPRGGDTCPRMVIEARLLGCELHMNENVLHRDEAWFNTDDLELTESYLLAAPGIFWNGIRKMMNYVPSISGYVTTYNCVSQEYPFEHCIRSMLQFCSEVCVVDGGSTDGTIDRLLDMMGSDNGGREQAHLALEKDGNVVTSDDGRIKLRMVKRDWDHPRHAVFDGQQKAEARAMCSGEFCWQMDSDEIVHEDDVRRIHELARNMPKSAFIVALPVIEYWGGPDKVRMDVTPWKWRLSRNLPDITHGIPRALRKSDELGTYAAPGTDGCDMISRETGDPIPFVNFYTQDVDNARRVALVGNEQARLQYEGWFNQVVSALPPVFHYSWYDIPRKIRLYRDYWQNHWNALYGKDSSDTAENNMFFDVPWSQVTDEMITVRGRELTEGTGGWIWHKKWGGQRTPHIHVARPQPGIGH